MDLKLKVNDRDANGCTRQASIQTLAARARGRSGATAGANEMENASRAVHGVSKKTGALRSVAVLLRISGAKASALKTLVCRSFHALVNPCWDFKVAETLKKQMTDA